MKPSERALLHAAVGAVCAEITNNNVGSTALAGGVNAFVVHSIMGKEHKEGSTADKLKKHFVDHPEQLQMFSGVLGTAVAGSTSGNVMSGASVAVKGTKENFWEKVPFIGNIVKEVVRNTPVYNDADGTCVGKMLSVSLEVDSTIKVGGEFNIVCSKNMVFEGFQGGCSLSAFRKDYSVREVRIYKLKEDGSFDYWVKDWSEFNTAIPGFSVGGCLSVGINNGFSVNPAGYVMVTSGVTSNAGISGSGGYSFSGIKKEEYVK